MPVELAMTDPALYRLLREQITTFYLRGGAFSLQKLETLAAASPVPNATSEISN